MHHVGGGKNEKVHQDALYARKRIARAPDFDDLGETAME